jgi:hypothetical protein
LYAFLGNQTITRLDVFGLIVSGPASSSLLSGLNSAKDKMRKVVTGVSGGMSGALSQMERILYADDISVVNGYPNGYNPGLRRITLDTPVDNGTIMHELVHVYNEPSRLNVYFGPSDRSTEGMAYGIEAMYNVMEKVHDKVQNILENETDCIEIQDKAASGWRSAWRYGDTSIGGQLNDSDSTAFNLNGSDFGNISEKLHAHVKCSEIAEQLNKLSISKRCCIRFSCENPGSNEWELGVDNGIAHITWVVHPAVEIIEAMK